jgi:uncharacterized protein YprB with RNaseH-like and TPR domain
MLEETYIHVPGIGLKTERRLWAREVRVWEDFLGLPQPMPGFSSERHALVCDHLREARRCLDRGEFRHFSATLPRSEAWRAWPSFRNRTAYLDIETTGMGAWAEVTVVGVYDGNRVRTYVHGDNLDDLPQDLAQFALLVTFNGAAFDLPFLSRRFRGLDLSHLHADLRHVLKRLGYRGGLKQIEREMGLERSERTAGLDGWDAVRLWNEYRAGNEQALELLIEYNTEDIVNLEHLMATAYERLRAQTLAAATAP